MLMWKRALRADVLYAVLTWSIGAGIVAGQLYFMAWGYAHAVAP